MNIDQAPDPTETVRVLKSDFDLLQAVANAAMEDYITITDILGIERPEGVAPRQVMHEAVYPVLVRLVETQHHVSDAANQIRAKAERFGNKTIEHNGVKGLMVGKKIPGIFEQSRRERREAEREARRRAR